MQDVEEVVGGGLRWAVGSLGSLGCWMLEDGLESRTGLVGILGCCTLEDGIESKMGLLDTGGRRRRLCCEVATGIGFGIL